MPTISVSTSKIATCGLSVTDLFNEPDDATPLTPEEREGLRQNWITLRTALSTASRPVIVASREYTGLGSQVQREALY